jgi:hypothetical protein
MATALKITPDAVRAIRFSDARALFAYWQDFPPDHELLRIQVMVQTTWEPKSAKAMTAEEAEAEHRRSLERRWAAGAMNIKDFYEATNGRLSATTMSAGS